MTSRVLITFRGVLPNDEQRALVERKFEKLCAQLSVRTRCHVVLSRAEGFLRREDRYCARIELSGGGVHVAAEAHHADLSSALRGAFDRLRAQSQRRVERAVEARA